MVSNTNPVITAADKCPELVSEWHKALNGDKTLADFSPGSNKFAWWKCAVADDHVWDTSISKRVNRGYGCPYCSGKRVCLSNSLAVAGAVLLAEFDEEATGFAATDIYYKSRTIVSWKCAKSHRWDISPAIRMRGNGCPYCSRRKVWPEDSLASPEFADYAKYFNAERNKVTLEELLPGSAKVVFWNCETGLEEHIHDMSVREKTGYGTNPSKQFGCPYCSNRRVNSLNNMFVTHPELAKEFDVEKNKITPDKIVAGSAKEYFWKCEKGHSWSATGATRVYMKTCCADCGAWNTSKGEQFFREAIAANDAFSDVKLNPNEKLMLAWGKRKSMALDVVARIAKTQENFVLEYDGSYYHHTDLVLTRDLRKTSALLDAGYVVVRVRENDLPFLDLVHPNLFQIHHKASLNLSKTEETLASILLWISGR